MSKLGIAIAVVIIAVLGFVAWMVFIPGPMAFASGATVALADYKGANPTGVPQEMAQADIIKRGEYLAHAADCVACHTAPGAAAYSGGFAFNMPFGTIYSTNITPDKETGIGNYTDAQFLAALHKGVRADGQNLYPAMSYTSYTYMTDADALAIKAYLFSLAPVHAPARANNLSWPFNQRAVLSLWNMVYSADDRFRPNPSQSAQWNRGAYLAEAMGHCGECHTPRNLAYALNNRSKFSGALTAGWRAYNISSDKDSGLGDWTDADIHSYLSTGHAEGHGGSAGPMGEATDNSLTFLTAGDIDAMTVYLRSVPAHGTDLPHTVTTPAPDSHKQGTPVADNMRGEQVFASACMSCHDWTGISPTTHYATLTGVRAVNDPSATNVAQTVINGVNRKTDQGVIYMPGFGEAYSDADIAAVANYVTARFGAKGAQLSQNDVTSLRQQAAQHLGQSIFQEAHMATENQIKFAESDAYLTQLIREARTMPAKGALPMQRRTFFKLTGAGAAGLVIGFHVPDSAFAATAAQPAVKDEGMNAYVRIAPDNAITIFSKCPEIGQGIKTAFGLIIAEELDADWNHVTVEQAPVNPKLYGAQGAGGSTSIPRNWDVLRQAGAGAKAMLVAAAAKKWNVNPAEITAKNSVLTHASGKTASYGSLATAAARLPVPDPKSLVLKTRAQYALLGKRYHGVDDPKVVTGKPLFGIDVQVPGMVYASFTKSPAVGGKVKSFNEAEIKAMPNVLDAFAIDGTGKPVECMPGVAIIAKDTWSAFQAKNKLKVDWDLSEASTDSSTRIAAQAKQIGPKFPAKADTDVGDVDKAFAARDAKVLEAFYEYPFASHATMEPMNTTAYWHDGVMEMWVPTQQPNRGMPQVAALAKIAEDKVIVHQMRSGGGFGRRLINDYMCEAASIALKCKAPVKMTWTREDDFAHDFLRPAGYHQYKGALDKDGKLDAWQEHFITFTADGKAASSGAVYTENTEASVIAPNLRRASTLLPLKIPTGPWRAPGDNGQVFAVQSFMHELSLASGHDHVQFLIDAVNRPVPELVKKGMNFNPARATAVLKMCAEKLGWGKKMGSGSGLGIAWCYSHAGHVAQGVEISVDANKRITIHHAVMVADIGPIVDMAGAESQGQGATIDAISTCMGLQTSFENGVIHQQNFNQYPTLRIPFAPRAIEAHFIQSNNPPTGMGEPAFPAFAPALGNAIFAATGVRVRSLPLRNLGYSI